MTKKQTKNTVMVSLAINFLEKLPESIVKFLMSIIGPKTKNPKMDMKGNWFAKLRATMASDEEQRDSRKAIPIKSNIEGIMCKFASDPCYFRTDYLKYSRNKIPINKNFPTLKNSFWACCQNKEIFPFHPGFCLKNRHPHSQLYS